MNGGGGGAGGPMDTSCGWCGSCNVCGNCGPHPGQNGGDADYRNGVLGERGYGGPAGGDSGPCPPSSDPHGNAGEIANGAAGLRASAGGAVASGYWYGGGGGSGGTGQNGGGGGGGGGGGACDDGDDAYGAGGGGGSERRPRGGTESARPVDDEVVLRTKTNESPDDKSLTEAVDVTAVVRQEAMTHKGAISTCKDSPAQTVVLVVAKGKVSFAVSGASDKAKACFAKIAAKLSFPKTYDAKVELAE